MSERSDKFEYWLACVGSVEFRTNGPQGGDAGHGGYLEIAFNTENGSTALEVEVDGGRPEQIFDSLVLRFRGDAEMEAAAEMFRFLSKRLTPSASSTSRRKGNEE